MIRFRALAVCASVIAASCGSPDPVCDQAVASLVDNDAWTAFDDAADFPDHRPSDARCPASSFGREGLVFEVDTGACSYLAVQQPVLAPIDECHSLSAILSHSRLLSTGGGEAHVALSVEGETVWQKSTPIPSESSIEQITWQPAAPIPAGAMLQLHLHNHGDNAWYLSNVERGPSAASQ